jgi:hypothetical protein
MKVAAVGGKKVVGNSLLSGQSEEWYEENRVK